MEFSSFKIKEGSTVNTYGQFVVKDVAWDDACGGEGLERALVNHLVKEFESKHGVDLHASPKAIAKLRKQVGVCKREGICTMDGCVCLCTVC